MMNEKEFNELDILACENIVRNLYSEYYQRAKLHLDQELPTQISTCDSLASIASKLSFINNVYNHFRDFLPYYSKQMLFRLYEMIAVFTDAEPTIYEVWYDYYSNQKRCKAFNIRTNDGMTEFLLFFYFYGGWRGEKNAK